MSGNIKNPQAALQHQNHHRIRRNMAGLVERPDIFERIVEALGGEDPQNPTHPPIEADFKQACRDAGIGNSGAVIENAELFIEKLWQATLAARQAQSMEPCW